MYGGPIQGILKIYSEDGERDRNWASSDEMYENWKKYEQALRRIID